MPLPMERCPSSLIGSERVLLVRLGAVGDVLRVLPAVRRLRAAMPSLHLAWIVEPLSAPLLDAHPDLDEVIRFPRRELRPDPAHPLLFAHACREFAARLRRGAWDVAVDFQGSLKSGLVAWRSGARRRIGFRPGETREFSFLFTNEWVTLPAPRLNRVDRNLEMARALGAAAGPADALIPERAAEGAEADAVWSRSIPSGPRVVISPGVSRRQAYKAWPPAYYAMLARLIASRTGTRPLVVWGPGEELLARSVVDAAAGDALLAPPTGLRALCALLRRADLFVGADTGPMHLAWVAGCRVVALFGPTDPSLNAPRGAAHVVLRAPDDRMDRLMPGTVATAVAAILAAPGRAGGAA